MNSNISSKNAHRQLIEAEIARLSAELEELKRMSVLGEDEDYATGDTIIVNYRFPKGGYDYTAALVKSGEHKWVTTVSQIKGTPRDAQAQVTFEKAADYFKHREIRSAFVLPRGGILARLV